MKHANDSGADDDCCEAGFASFEWVPSVYHARERLHYAGFLEGEIVRYLDYASLLHGVSGDEEKLGKPAIVLVPYGLVLSSAAVFLSPFAGFAFATSDNGFDDNSVAY